MRLSILAVSMALAAIPAAPAMAQVSLSFNTPGLSIGVNIPTYPDLELVPDYPVYYAPGLASNLFYYDGVYWLLQDDSWYASTWYNGPWQSVGAQDVPLFVLRVPVRYYRSPPVYFRGWQGDAPPRWDDHWGPDWSQHHRGWDQWNRRDAPRPAPLPTYQRQYSGARYPQAEQQRVIRQQNDRYEPHDEAVRRRIQQAPQPAPAKAPQAAAPQQPDQRHAQREQAPQREQQQRQQQQGQQAQQSQQQKQQGQQLAQHEQQQRQQPQDEQQKRGRQEQQPAAQNKPQPPTQEQHAAGREQERPAAPAHEPAREAKPAPERNREHDKADQGNEEKK